jgi:hypothetical protein
MKKLIFSVLLLSLVGATLAVPAYADSVYSSGAVNGNYDAWQINSSKSVSDSITLAQNGFVYSATFASWLNPGDTMSSIQWSLGTTAYGSQLGSGTATTSVFLNNGNNTFGFDVVTESISGIDVMLLAGNTYYFTLQSAVVTAGDAAYWDVNNGSSSGFSSTLTPAPGSISSFYAANDSPGLSGGETFAFSGTPEPSSFLLLGSGLMGLAGLLKRKLAA